MLQLLLPHCRSRRFILRKTFAHWSLFNNQVFLLWKFDQTFTVVGTLEREMSSRVWAAQCVQPLSLRSPRAVRAWAQGSSSLCAFAGTPTRGLCAGLSPRWLCFLWADSSPKMQDTWINALCLCLEQCDLFYGKLLPWMAQAPGESHRQPALLPPAVGLRFRGWGLPHTSGGSCTQLGVLGAAGSSEMQTGLLMHVLFFFNRKMTISRNALKLSSRTLSSSTERSECVGCFF